MRTATKILAAIALAAASVSSFAQATSTWTGTLTSVKIQYFPSNAGYNLPGIQLSGTGSTCSFPVAGIMSIGASATGNSPDDVRKFYDFLLHAKATTASVTLTYLPGGMCAIQNWTRN
jgi:hypothetical protein